MRTVAAYKRVKQLPPPPGPWARFLLEEVLLKPAIGPGLRNAIRALPTIGDALAEAELADVNPNPNPNPDPNPDDFF